MIRIPLPGAACAQPAHPLYTDRALRAATNGIQHAGTARRWCCAAGLAILLGACASPNRPLAPLSAPAGAHAVQALHAYHGRFAISYEDQNGQPRNAYGNFDWQQSGETVKLQLLNPLGQTLAIIASAPGLATLELPNKTPQTAPSVSNLMQHTLGFSLPVEGLRYWLQPSVAPTSHATTATDDAGRLTRVEQDGWTIDYVAYADAPPNDIKRVNLTRQTPPLTVKLVLDQ